MNKPMLSTELVIKEVLDNYPETVEVFVKNKMNCVGCVMSGFMTVGDAIQIYQLEEEVFLEELQTIINRTV